jgi:type VI secretion system secreted protein Hcp
VNSKNVKYYLIVIAALLIVIPIAAYNLSQMEVIDDSAKNIAYTQYEEGVVDTYLKIEKIEGSSTRIDHEGEIEVRSYFWGETQDVDLSAGTKVGKVKMDDLKLVIPFDPLAAPLLMHACASGQIIPDAIISVMGPGPEGSRIDILKIKLQNVVVSSYLSSSENNAKPVDEITFAYSKITFDYFTDEGALLGFYWDLATNQGGTR